MMPSPIPPHLAGFPFYAAHQAWLRDQARYYRHDPGGAEPARANLARAYLADANLADANLAGAYLAGAYLAGANLADANLAGANLAGANLAGANLAGANLADAYLADANLARANLADAYLADAYLADAYLADANLAGANLADAYLADADLADADLAGARNVPQLPASTDGAPREPYKRATTSEEVKARRVERAKQYRERYPEVPYVENLDARILDAITTGGGQLNMGEWHSCETTHCRAGWAVNLSGPAGYALEKEMGPERAGAAIYRASTGRVPYFYGSTERTLEDIKRCADEAQP
jgi:hypothetical protein